MERPAIIFRTEGGFKTGLGHIKRCLHLADFLKEHFNPEITFVLSPSDMPVENLFQGRLFETCLLVYDDESTLTSICERKSPQIWVTDLRKAGNKSLIQNLAKKFQFLHILIDDMHLSEIESEITINPSVLSCDLSKHSYHNGRYYCGPEYFFHFPNNLPPKVSQKNGKRILISMGGSDINKVTEKLLNSFVKKTEKVEIHFVVGPAFAGQFFPEENENIFAHHSPENLEPLISLVDLVVTSAGLTLYEAVRLGVPAVAIPQNHYELRTANAFQERGAALNMGVGNSMDPDHVVTTALSLLKDRARRKKMSILGREILPGNGAETVKMIINDSLTKKMN